MHHVIAVEMSTSEDGWNGKHTLHGIQLGVATCGQNGQIQSIWGNVWMEGGLTLCLWHPSRWVLCLCLGTCCLVTTPPHLSCICAAPSPNWGRRSALCARWPTPSPWHFPWHMSPVQSSCGGSVWSSPMCHQPSSLWGTSSSLDHFWQHILELYPWDVVLGCCLLYESVMHCMFPGTIGVQQQPCPHQNPLHPGSFHQGSFHRPLGISNLINVWFHPFWNQGCPDRPLRAACWPGTQFQQAQTK